MKTALAIVLLTASLASQDQWVRKLTANYPSPRVGAAMAFDSVRNVVVMFSGITGSVRSRETWEYNGINWFRSIDGPNLDSASMAFDPIRTRLVVNGALNGGSNSTWTFDGQAWTDLGASGIGSTSGGTARMCFDSARNRLVNVTSGTWEWDGTSWAFVPSQVPPTNGAPTVFHSARGTCMQVAGAGRYLLERIGTEWFTYAPPTYPTASSFAYDGDAQAIMSYGGQGFFYLDETWELTGLTWKKLFPINSPGPRADHSMAYDSVRKVMVMFGGNGPSGQLGDTWEYVRGSKANYRTFGAGCVGSRGSPVLLPRLGDLPRVGQPFTIQLSNLPLAGTAYMFLGTSNTSYGGLSLPFSLDAIGMSGCTLYCSGDVLFTAPIVLGTAVFGIAIPSFPGFTFYNQGFVTDPSANILGLTASNAGEGMIGS